MNYLRHCGWASLVIAGVARAGEPPCNQLGWSAMPGLPSPFSPAIVRSVATLNDGGGSAAAVYVGGAFTMGMVGGQPANKIAKWDGENWSPLGSGISTGEVHSLYVHDDGSGSALYVGGSFTSAGGVPAQSIAKWDGAGWSAVSTPAINGFVFAMTTFDDGGGPALYVGGSFATAGTVFADRIAKWDGQQWSPLAGGLDGGTLNALTVWNDGTGPALYATGRFTHANGILVNGIAKWDGKTWAPLGTGLSGGYNTTEGFAIAAINHGPAFGLYVGGDFYQVDGVDAKRLARWDGNSWSAIGDPPTNIVRALAVYDDGNAPVLHAGASAPSASYDYVQRVRRWDGASWMSLGAHLSEEVYVLHADHLSPDAPLYAGGFIDNAGGQPANLIARWHTAAPFQDCNRNAFVDECDVASGVSGDCNANGVPDECDSPFTYQLDSGQVSNYWAPVNPGDYLWLNQFTVKPGGEIITHIAMPWTPFAPDGTTIKLLIYDDPDNDGNPQDALLLSSTDAGTFCIDGYVANPVYARIRVPPTYVGKPDESFFVGAFNTTSFGTFPAPAEQHQPTMQRSWSLIGGAGTLNLQELSQNPNTPTQLSQRDWNLCALALDCNQNGVWDDCDIVSGTSADRNGNGVPDECESQPCPADVAGNDGVVGVLDLLAVINTWGSCPPPPDPCATDIVPDGAVNVSDLLAVINAWGPCP